MNNFREDLFVDKLFETAGLNRSRLSAIIVDSYAKGFDNLTYPFKAPAFVDESSRTGIAEIATQRSIDVKVQLFDPFLLKAVLELEAPSTVLASSTLISVETGKGKGSKAAGGSKVKPAVKEVKRSTPTNADDLLGNSKRRRSASTAVSAVKPNIELKAETVFVTATKNISLSELNRIMTSIFESFWQMEFDNTDITAAFFAKINSRNCVDYGLESFAIDSTSLPVIKEKLERGMYPSLELFAFDFRKMFENIMLYYPHNGVVVEKAKELAALFDESLSKAREST